MSVAVWVVVTALAPVIVSRCDLAGHEIWLVCSLLALALFLGLWIVNYRTPEMREETAAASRAEIVPGVAVNLLLVAPPSGRAPPPPGATHAFFWPQ